jgi:hypothetical protein
MIYDLKIALRRIERFVAKEKAASKRQLFDELLTLDIISVLRNPSLCLCER